jgi:hypothetical protein
MKTKNLILAILSVMAYINCNALITCNSFCVTNIRMDTTTTHIMDVTIFMSGTSNDFINYPYVSVITDSIGDTIATGVMNFFGQFGNTSQTYQVNTSWSSIPSNFHCTVYFKHDSVTCTLLYPCSTSGIKEEYSSNKINIYPNPNNGNFILFYSGNQTSSAQSGLYELEIMDELGRTVYTQTFINPNQTKINISQLSNGVHFYQLTIPTQSGKETVRGKFVKEQE